VFVNDAFVYVHAIIGTYHIFLFTCRRLISQEMIPLVSLPVCIRNGSGTQRTPCQTIGILS